MNTPAEPPRDGSRLLLFTLIGVAVMLALILAGIGGFLFLRSSQSSANRASRTAAFSAEAKDFSQSNSVTYWAGAAGVAQGMAHLDQQSDGATRAHTLDGVPTRKLSLTGARAQLNFYFQIDPTFKQQDVKTVRIDVEYLDPYDGTMGVHYDALDVTTLGAPDKDRAYKDGGRKNLTGADTWQTASFYTRDAAFRNRQNSGADFRVWARTPLLYIRRVTVTRVDSPEEDWKTDYSKTNSVSIVIANESPQDGLRHLAAEPDGRTTLTNLNGVVCRHMTREGKPSGYLYFTISPTFKRAGLSNAVCEIEYLCPTRGTFRMQYDAVELETHRPYKSVTAEDGTTVRYGGNNEHTRVPSAHSWESATFRITDAVFANSQNGGADFRFEFTPPDVYVRRVILSRDTSPTP